MYALITGASSGFGKEFANLLAKKKYNLVLVARSTSRLKKIKADLEKKYKINVLIKTQDLSDQNSAGEVKKFLKYKKIKINVLINNAGFGDYAEFEKSDWSKLSEMINLNIYTLTSLTKLFLPEIKKNKGKIMNVASTAAFFPGPLMAVYYASKAYVLSFSVALAEELEESGVTVTALCPGISATGFQKSTNLENSKLVKNKKLTSAKSVAKYGIESMFEGKKIAIMPEHRFSLLASYLPREIQAKLVRNTQEE